MDFLSSLLGENRSNNSAFKYKLIVYSLIFLKISVALCPPNPKVLLRA